MKIKLHYAVMFACLLWLLFLSPSPIISRDALIHHMALPKLWIERGLFSVDSYRDYAFYPSNIQALYQEALFYDLEFLPKIIHSSFLFFTGCIVYQYLKSIGISTHLASLAFLMILTIPICDLDHSVGQVPNLACQPFRRRGTARRAFFRRSHMAKEKRHGTPCPYRWPMP